MFARADPPNRNAATSRNYCDYHVAPGRYNPKIAGLHVTAYDVQLLHPSRAHTATLFMRLLPVALLSMAPNTTRAFPRHAILPQRLRTRRTRTYMNASMDACTHVRIRTCTRPQPGHSPPIPVHLPSCHIGQLHSRHLDLRRLAFHSHFVPAFLFETPPPSPTHNTCTGTNFVQTSSKPQSFGVDKV